jgi:ABC-type transporter Mla MlaB component
MLRITLEENPAGPTIVLEGRLVGPWVQEFKTYWQSTCGSEEQKTIRIDLQAVTSIDGRGKALLKHIHQQGASFTASGCLTKAIVEDVISADGKKDTENTKTSISHR